MACPDPKNIQVHLTLSTFAFLQYNNDFGPYHWLMARRSY